MLAGRTLRESPDPAIRGTTHRVLVDYPGVNLSSGATPGVVAGLARSVAEFIDGLGLQQVDLLGWSMGGYVVQDLCLNRPGLIRRLVIAASGPGAVPGTPAPPDKLRQVAAKPVNDDEDFLYMFFPETEPSRRAGLASLRRLDARLTESSAGTAGESVAAQGAALAGWAKGENTSWDASESSSCLYWSAAAPTTC